MSRHQYIKGGGGAELWPIFPHEDRKIRHRENTKQKLIKIVLIDKKNCIFLKENIAPAVNIAN